MLKMVLSGRLKKSIFISFVSHVAAFVVFSFSFGLQITRLGSASVSFCGAVLRNSDLNSYINRGGTELINNKNQRNNMRARGPFIKNPAILVLDKIRKESLLKSEDYYKPPITIAMDKNKVFLPKNLIQEPLFLKRSESTIMFYPKLPYYFVLYFKDRQNVHIELMFNTISTGKGSSVIIKRKISSGNLEADLLSMRYIGRYLFMQKTEFIPNNWQTVKIDLSTKER